MKPFLHSPALNSIHLGGKKNTSHCAFKLQHHLFHKRMTKDAVPGYRLEKLTLKEETGGGRIQGTKFLKRKKEGKVQQSKTERS